MTSFPTPAEHSEECYQRPPEPVSEARMRLKPDLISLDGKSAALFTMPELREMFIRAPGTVLKLEFEREKEILFKELTIESLH